MLHTYASNAVSSAINSLYPQSAGNLAGIIALSNEKVLPFHAIGMRNNSNKGKTFIKVFGTKANSEYGFKL